MHMLNIMYFIVLSIVCYILMNDPNIYSQDQRSTEIGKCEIDLLLLEYDHTGEGMKTYIIRSVYHI
jgi:hypothetical protein